MTLLNEQLASALDLYLRVRQSHWNVRGPQFFARHELFDQLGDHLHEMADNIAERIGALGGLARGAVKNVAAESELPDDNQDMGDVTSHIRALVHCYSAFAAQLRRGLDASEAWNDPVSEDVLIETLRAVEKDMWFLDSHLPTTRTPARPSAPSSDAGGAQATVEDEEELASVMYS